MTTLVTRLWDLTALPDYSGTKKQVSISGGRRETESQFRIFLGPGQGESNRGLDHRILRG